MGSNYIRKHLMPSLMAGMFLILSACQGTSQDVEGRIAKMGKDGEGKIPRITEDAVLTANKKEPVAILPYLLASVPAFSKLGVDKGAAWTELVKVKNWYMGNTDVSEKFNGLISLTRYEGTDQFLAHQTQYEVFVNSVLLEQLTKDKRNDAILEEFLTSLFTLKHLDDTALCALMKDVYKDKVKDCATHAEGAREAADEKQSLPELSDGGSSDIANSVDLESRADAAANVKKNAQTSPRDKMIKAKSILNDEMNDIKKAAKYLKDLSEEQVDTQNVINMLKSLNFDTRVFDYKVGTTTASTGKEGENKTAKTATLEERNNVISQMAKAAAQEMSCALYGEGEGKAQKCALKLESVTDEKTGVKKLLVKIEVDGKQMTDDTLVLGSDKAEFNMATYTDSSTKQSYKIFGVSSALMAEDKKKESTIYRNYYVLATVSAAGPLQFAGLYSAPRMVKSVEVDDTGKTTKCVGAGYRSNETPGILVSSTSLVLPKGFAEGMTTDDAACY